ncbi:MULTISPECIES: sulfur carrier protein ThiS [unclassified Campylobacter]|uniref:sulfur carrier protein ThiS n=1 Tax=unclassified Campylobacter TaxID=2593542 RepID=UPI0014732EA2|nr:MULTISPECIES: sulfur carrier protein ThiS [unclassified Campylobacter]QKF92315.1 thiamine biosynthesis protein [Campylobacter sp. CCUG 57310]
MLIINGKDESEFIGRNLQDFLSSKNFKSQQVVAELNGEILPKDKFDTILNDGDRVEIVCFVGGG